MNISSFASGQRSHDRHLLLGLVLVLALQALLTLVLYTKVNDYSPANSSLPLLKFEPAKVQKIILEQRQGGGLKKLTLSKEKNLWKLDDYAKFPVQPIAANQLINLVCDLENSYPISTSADEAERYKVSEDTYQQAIRLVDYQGKETSVFIGSSPSFKSYYLKTNESDNVYSAEIPDYRLSMDLSNLIDVHGIEFSPAELNAISTPGVKLTRDESHQWLSSDPKFQGAQHLSELLAHINVIEILGLNDEPKYNLARPSVAVSMETRSGRKFEYRIAQPDGQDYCVLKISDRPWYLKIDGKVVRAINSCLGELSAKSKAS